MDAIAEYEKLMLPSWATGPADGRIQSGAQLCTRDGRNIGNAVVIGEAERYGLACWQVCTDAGTELFLTDQEIADWFWPPEWLMDVKTSPGVRLRNAGGLPLALEVQTTSNQVQA